MVKRINIDKERCIRCGMCINDCFVGCLAFDEDGFPLACLAFFLQQKGCSITDIYIKDLSPIMLIVIYIQ